ncbi:MAG: sensor histidine kinase [Burkholderiales bacterium]|nr:sensor histidine kinase [Burkholderiales bacterium]
MKKMRSPRISIRGLLFRWLLWPLLLVLLVTVLVGYPVALSPAKATYDWVLLDTAHSLARLLDARRDVVPRALSGTADILLRADQFDRIYYAVHDLEGNLIAGDAHLLPPPPEAFVSRELLYDKKMDDEPVRVAALRVGIHGVEVIIQVAETGVKRGELARRILSGMIIGELLLMVVVVALVLFGIGKGLEPLERLREEIGARSHRDLRPVSVDHAPLEVQPLVATLNELLGRLEAMLRSQQRFVANAAHQLRTPLAGILMQAEFVLSQNDPEERLRARESLKASTERTVHIANQLLALARAEAGSVGPGAFHEVDLCRVAEDVADNWMAPAIRKNIDLGYELKSAPVRGDPLLLGELLSNLIDNAIAYAPQGGRVTVYTMIRDGRAVLEVEDNGAGIPEEVRELVFDRFYRAEGAAGDGCGLGLAIVREIAHLHGGRTFARSSPGGRGTVMAVEFPLAAWRPAGIAAAGRAACPGRGGFSA